MRVKLDELSRQQLKSYLTNSKSPSLFETFVHERQELKGRRERVSLVQYCSRLCVDVSVSQDYIKIEVWISAKRIADEELEDEENERLSWERSEILEMKFEREGWDDCECVLIDIFKAYHA